MQNFINNLDWFMLLKAFVVGGIICVIGQILIDKTKLTPARILVSYVTAGAVLGGLGIYKYLIDFAGAGATVPLTGFGSALAKGAIEGIQQDGVVGIFTGGVKAAARWNIRSNLLPDILLHWCQSRRLRSNKKGTSLFAGLLFLTE